VLVEQRHDSVVVRFRGMLACAIQSTVEDGAPSSAAGRLRLLTVLEMAGAYASHFPRK
jgi:hypothetical protein